MFSGTDTYLNRQRHVQSYTWKHLINCRPLFWRSSAKWETFFFNFEHIQINIQNINLLFTSDFGHGLGNWASYIIIGSDHWTYVRMGRSVYCKLNVGCVGNHFFFKLKIFLSSLWSLIGNVKKTFLFSTGRYFSRYCVMLTWSRSHGRMFEWFFMYWWDGEIWWNSCVRVCVRKDLTDSGRNKLPKNFP